MNHDNFKTMLTEQSLQDLWWLALDENVLDEQLTLDEIIKLRKDNPSSSFSLLNIAFTEDSDAEWFDLDDAPSTKTKAPFSPQTQGAVAQELQSLSGRVGSMETFLKQIHEHFIRKENLEMKEAELKEREKFLEESEEALLSKIQQQEEQLAELDQMREEIDSEKKPELKAV